LLFGNEGHGLETDIVAQCQRRITIPMPQDVDSLNVSIAAGIFIYHFMRGGWELDRSASAGQQSRS
jgi:TrmH family RNA methyltransferase